MSLNLSQKKGAKSWRAFSVVSSPAATTLNDKTLPAVVDQHWLAAVFHWKVSGVEFS